MKKQLYIEELQQDLKYIKQGLQTLEHSFAICNQITLNDTYSLQELDHWEALTARFSRLSDIITQKIFNNIMLVLEGETGSLIDKANFAEKHLIINKAEEFRNLRYTRNFIAHEYTLQVSNEVFESVL